MKQTISTNSDHADRQWYIIDVAGMPLGRAASAIATVVMGKHKPDFVYHVDTGDFVVVLNAAQIRVTGAKGTDKLYRWHSRYPGHMRTRSFNQMMDQDPRKVMEMAVRRMLPKNKIGDQLIQKVKVYRDNEGASRHVAQAPQPFPEHVLVGPRGVRLVRAR